MFELAFIFGDVELAFRFGDEPVLVDLPKFVAGDPNAFPVCEFERNIDGN
jgi:hypothetical protein